MAQQGLTFGRLEPYDGKLSRTVLRGERGGNAPDLPGHSNKLTVNVMIESVAQSLKSFLPNQPKKVYPPVGHCIYCGKTEDLTVEHVIPYGLGGRIELPESSCSECNRLTSSFEHTCLRTMYGPLRLLYDLPSRRKKNRPKTLRLKVKHRPTEDWTYVDVEQEKYPFLILFPYFSKPKTLTEDIGLEFRGAVTDRLWIRGASPSFNFQNLLERLTIELKVHSIMPEAKAHVKEFCQMLAKIGYSFAVGELGVDAFEPLLIPHILHKKLDDCDRFIGSLSKEEKASNNLHEISIVDTENEDLVTIRIRLLAKLGTPTYYVIVGRYHN